MTRKQKSQTRIQNTKETYTAKTKLAETDENMEPR